MAIFAVLASSLLVVAGLLLVGPQRARPGLAIIAYMLLGGLLGLSPLELGIYGLVLSAATLLALLFVPSGVFVSGGQAGAQRLERVGGYLAGAGAGGIALLLPLVMRIHNVCEFRGGTVGLAPGQSYECYSAITLWALLFYAALGALGAVIVFVGIRQSWVSQRPSRNST